jgi:hypothetical protein
MTTNVVPNHQYWRDRAEKARLHAERMIEPASKRMMIEVAEHYESLVQRAGKKLLGSANTRGADLSGHERGGPQDASPLLNDHLSEGAGGLDHGIKSGPRLL